MHVPRPAGALRLELDCETVPVDVIVRRYGLEIDERIGPLSDRQPELDVSAGRVAGKSATVSADKLHLPNGFRQHAGRRDFQFDRLKHFRNLLCEET